MQNHMAKYSWNIHGVTIPWNKIKCLKGIVKSRKKGNGWLPFKFHVGLKVDISAACVWMENFEI